MEHKRYKHVLFANPGSMETDKQVVVLYSETKDVPPEILAEASQAAKDFGLKGELTKLKYGTCVW